MNYKKIFLTFTTILAFSTSLIQATDFIEMSKASNEVLLGHYLAIQEKNTKYTAVDIFNLPSKDFRKIDSLSDTNFGTNYNKIWLKFKITNQSQKTITKALSNIGLTKSLKIYIFDKSNNFIKEISSGNHLDTKDLPYQLGRYAVPVTLAPKESIHLVAEFIGYHLSEVQFKLQDIENLKKENNRDLILWSLFYGLMIGLFIYNFLMYLSQTSNKSSLYYSFFIISISIYYFCFFNPFGIYQLKLTGLMSDYLYYASTATIFFALFFIFSFLETKNKYKNFHFTLTSFLYLNTILLIIYVLVPSYQSIVTLIQQSGFGIIAFILTCLLIKDFHLSRKRSGLYLLLAWSSFSTSIILGSFYVHHMIMTSETIKYILMLGSISEIIFMSLALTEKINEARRFVLNQFIDIQKQLTQNLNIETYEIEQTQEKVKTAELLAALGGVASSLAHEINNPLTIVQGNIRKCLRVIKKSDISLQDLENITQMKKYADHIAEIVRSLHFLGSNDLGLIKKEVLSLSEIINFSHESKRILLEKHNISLIINSVYDLKVNADKENLVKAYANLIQNSIDSLESTQLKNKEIQVKIEKKYDQAIISITDNGPGINLKDNNDIFTAFYSTRKATNHIGLGLNFTKKILEANDAMIKTDLIEDQSSYYIQTKLKIAA